MGPPDAIDRRIGQAQTHPGQTMDDRWWTTPLWWVLWLLSMSLIMGWIGRSRLRARPDSETGRLTQTWALFIVGLFCFLVFVAMAVVSNVIPNTTTTWWTTAIFVGLACLGVPLVTGFFLEQYQASPDGLAGTNFIGIERQLRWSELRSVRYSLFMKWFWLETQSGTVIRISAMLTGLPEFARLLLANAPAEAIDAETLKLLRATAAGDPPSVWT
jgi:hypothetical protein